MVNLLLFPFYYRSTESTCSFYFISAQQCSFLKGKKRYDYDPCNRSLLGPRSCEYCKAETTLKCAWDCERPKLFSLKKRPPFESRDGWDPVTEYQTDAYYKDPLIDTNGICIETNTSKRREADGLVTFFRQTPNLICSFFQFVFSLNLAPTSGMLSTMKSL